ncbi:unnamed protein product, partial [Rotaria sp. Silwood2]
NIKLETLITSCKETIKIYQEKQVDLIPEHFYDLLQKLNEKQNFIELL